MNSGSRCWIPVILSVWILIVSRIPDSLSCIPDSKSQDSKFHKQKFPRFRNPAWIQDSNCYWDSGFLELYSGFQSPGFRIPQQKFPTFRNVDSLIWGRPVNALPFKVTKLVSRSARSLKADFVQRKQLKLSDYFFITTCFIESVLFFVIYYTRIISFLFLCLRRKSLRPCPQVSVFVWKRNFFSPFSKNFTSTRKIVAFSPVHTYTINRFQKTIAYTTAHAWRIRVCYYEPAK